MDAHTQEKEMLTCPVCGKQFYKDVDGSEIGFCPFCGTKMSFEVGTKVEVIDESKIDESKENDISNATEASKENIELTEASESKENVEITEASESKENVEITEASDSNENTEIKETDELKKDSEVKDTDEIKDTDELKVTDELKDSNELKDNYESIVAGELKENVDLKEAGELNVNNELTAINESQDINKLNEADSNSLKEIDAFKSDQIAINDANAIQPVVQPVLGYNPEQDKAANVNVNPYCENTAPMTECGNTAPMTEYGNTAPITEYVNTAPKTESENAAPKNEEVSQDAEKAKTEPEKEARPYDVIFGTILLAIGIILIFAYLITTPKEIVNEHNTEAIGVQTEQMAEPNPGP